MKKIFIVLAVVTGLAFSAGPAFLQETKTPESRQEHGTMGGGMMQHGGMGMMGGGMGGMMGGMGGGDPQKMGQMMQLRGEMMMKMGEVMLKYGKQMQDKERK
jgi:hypothetical protein